MLKHEYPLADPVDSISTKLSNFSIKKPQQSFTLPLTPSTTLINFKSLLSVHELHEITLYPHIYFVGAAHVQKINTHARRTGAALPHLNVGTNESDENVYNHGYDDTRGDYYLTKHDHIGYRYEILSLLGKGSFGQVVKCYDHKKKIHVAVKLIRNKKRFEKQGVVEVKILQHLKENDPHDQHSAIHIQDNFYFRNHLCITFELLGINLYEWIQAGGFRGVHLGIIREFARQILSCLSLLENCSIIHCDLKPENILIKQVNNIMPLKSESNSVPIDHSKPSRIPPDFDPNNIRYIVKVIDFGSSCFIDERVYTYVQSRFYRSPEIILGIPYSCGIDMWSFGCILVELFTGYPLFPGENENEQLSCIMEIFGIPNIELIERGTRKGHFFDGNGMPKISANSKGKRRRPNTKSLTNTVVCGDASFLDFIRKCLEWDPLQRMTADEGLRHPWITGSKSRLHTSDAYNSGGLVGNRERPTYSSYDKSNSYNTLPEVRGNQFQKKKDFSSFSFKSLSGYSPSSNNISKSYSSSGFKNFMTQATAHRIKPPIIDRLHGVENIKRQMPNTGLPPITLSHKNATSWKPLNTKERLPSTSTTKISTGDREAPPWRH